MEIVVKQDSLDKYKRGFPLLTADDVNYTFNEDDEGKLAKLTDRQGKYIASAYIGKQNKGLGWVYSFDRRTVLSQSFITKNIRRAVDARERFFANKATTAFRIFNSYGDGIGGLTIDYFAGFVLINWYNRGIFKYKETIVNSIISTLKPKGIYQKLKFKDLEIESKGSHIQGEKTPEDFHILENNIKYSINFNDGNMVGIFLDQREVRKMLSTSFSLDKTVLNTFSYTGAFSVASLKGSAQHTTSIDLAKRSLEKTKHNFQLNDIEPDSQKINVEDVFNFFKYALRKKLSYDIVVLDPPSFAKSKKRTFSVLKNYAELVETITPLVASNGYIIASTNNSKLSLINFKKMINKGLNKTGRDFKIEKVFRLPKDFKVADTYLEENYLKVVLVRVGE